jgi:hypothetical protein
MRARITVGAVEFAPARTLRIAGALALIASMLAVDCLRPALSLGSCMGIPCLPRDPEREAGNEQR